MTDSHSTLDDEAGDQSRGDGLETCHFWDSRAGECRYEMPFLGCEPCTACPEGDWPMTRTTGPRYETARELTERTGETDTVVCTDCGVFVMDVAAHDRFHAISDRQALALAILCGAHASADAHGKYDTAARIGWKDVGEPAGDHVPDEAAGLGITQAEMDREAASLRLVPSGHVPGAGAVSGLVMQMLADSPIGRSSPPGAGHRIYCRGCRQSWAEDADAEESGCACTCTDPALGHYEDWITDPEPGTVAWLITELHQALPGVFVTRYCDDVVESVEMRDYGRDEGSGSDPRVRRSQHVALW